MGSSRILFDNNSLFENGSGATEFTPGVTVGESVQCFCVNNNVNSNIQGARNSILVRNRITMGDSGVSLSFNDIRIEVPELGDNKSVMILSYHMRSFWFGITMVVLLVVKLLLLIFY